MKGLLSVKKIILAFVIITIIISNAEAQIRDSVLVYLNKDEQPIGSKVGAASIRIIIHTDSTFSSGQKVAIIKDYYMSGKLKSVSQSYFDISKGFTPIFNGTRSDFFENGHLKQISKYVDGVQSDVATRYYPDGRFYCDFKVDSKQRIELMNCNDTTGNKICINGNGRWIKYVDDGFKSKSEGFVKKMDMNMVIGRVMMEILLNIPVLTHLEKSLAVMDMIDKAMFTSLKSCIPMPYSMGCL